LYIKFVVKITTGEEFTVNPSTQAAYAGSKAEISCLSEVPPVWTKSNDQKFRYEKLLPYDGRIESIVIYDVHPQDTGTYFCSGRHLNRDFTEPFHLVVGGKCTA